jgi:hypothetical protein
LVNGSGAAVAVNIDLRQRGMLFLHPGDPAVFLEPTTIMVEVVVGELADRTAAIKINLPNSYVFAPTPQNLPVIIKAKVAGASKFFTPRLVIWLLAPFQR